jgi:hypothetical protein
MSHVTEKRQEESSRIREKYPDRIPVSFLFLSLSHMVYFPFPMVLFSFEAICGVCGTGHC